MKITKVRFIGILPPPIGGVTIHTYRLFSWLKKNDEIDIKLTSLNNVKQEKKGIEYIGNKIIWVIKKVLFGFNEDVVHYHGSNYGGLIFLSIVKMIHNDFKFVWSIQGEHIVPMIEKKHKIFQRILFDVDMTVVANKNIKNDLLSMGIKSKNIIQLSPFLMPLKSKKVKLLEKYKTKKILVFNAYRLELRDEIHDIYGFGTLINAFKKINKDTILILLIPIMNENEKKYFKKCLSKLTKEDEKRVVHIQDQNNQGWQYISQADIFIRPTITDGDALSIREALCFQVPAVVSDCVDRPEEAIKFKTSDSDDLASKVNYIIENYELEKSKLGNISFCEYSKGKQYLNIYKKLGESSDNFNNR